jgi:hypothetical protein
MITAANPLFAEPVVRSGQLFDRTAGALATKQ